jgi:hypothetical protein
VRRACLALGFLPCIAAGCSDAPVAGAGVAGKPQSQSRGQKARQRAKKAARQQREQLAALGDGPDGHNLPAVAVAAPLDASDAARVRREAAALVARPQRAADVGVDLAREAASLSRQAGVAQSRGDMSKASRLYSAALAMLRRLHGDESQHPDIALVMQSLGSTLLASGDVVQGASMLRQSLAIMRIECGPEGDCVEVATTLRVSAE